MDWMRPLKPQNVREEGPPGAGNQGWWQIFPAYPNMQALSPIHILVWNTCPDFSYGSSQTCQMKKKYQERCLPQEGKEGWCVFHRDPSSGWKLPSKTIHFRHMNKTYGLHMNCFKNCSEFPSSAAHQPGFANTCVLQHVPVADCCGWLHLLRTKQTPFIEISSVGKPESSSARLMKPHFLTHKFCTHCQSAQLCKLTSTHQMVLVLLHQNCWCAQGSAKMHHGFSQLNTLPSHRKNTKGHRASLFSSTNSWPVNKCKSLVAVGWNNLSSQEGKGNCFIMCSIKMLCGS